MIAYNIKYILTYHIFVQSRISTSFQKKKKLPSQYNHVVGTLPITQLVQIRRYILQ